MAVTVFRSHVRSARNRRLSPSRRTADDGVNTTALRRLSARPRLPQICFSGSFYQPIQQESPLAIYLLRRLGLAVLTLFFSASSSFLRRTSAGDPGPCNSWPYPPSPLCGPRPPARRGPATDRPVLDLDHGPLRGNLGVSYQYQSPGRAAPGRHPGQLGQAGAASRSSDHPDWHTRRRGRRDLRRRPVDRTISLTGPSRRRPCPSSCPASSSSSSSAWAEGLRRRRSARPGASFPPMRSPDPARAVAGIRAVRVHRADGPGGDDRGAGLRLHADRDIKGLPRTVVSSDTCCATRCCRRSRSWPPRPAT